MTSYIKTAVAALMLASAAAISSPARGRDTSRDVSIKVDRIWSNGKYCAFTSMTRFRDRYYIAFREGDTHIWGDDGKADGDIRILSSKNGRRWESVAILGMDGSDLRDPDLSVTPDGRLMLLTERAVYVGKERRSAHTCVAFSDDGRTFSEIVPVDTPKDRSSRWDWLWKVSWQGRDAYGVCYSVREKDGAETSLTDLHLFRTRDGVDYSFVTDLPVPAECHPNETSLGFMPDGRMCVWVRREGQDGRGWWGVSEPPYTSWKFTDMGMRLGGPDFLIVQEDIDLGGGKGIPAGTVIGATRSYAMWKAIKTVLVRGDADGHFEQVAILPSGGGSADTAYAGLLIVGKELWVSYYSAHETPNPSIYFARVPLKVFAR